MNRNIFDIFAFANDRLKEFNSENESNGSSTKTVELNNFSTFVPDVGFNYHNDDSTCFHTTPVLKTTKWNETDDTAKLSSFDQHGTKEDELICCFHDGEDLKNELKEIKNCNVLFENADDDKSNAESTTLTPNTSDTFKNNVDESHVLLKCNFDFVDNCGTLVNKRRNNIDSFTTFDESIACNNQEVTELPKTNFINIKEALLIPGTGVYNTSQSELSNCIANNVEEYAVKSKSILSNSDNMEEISISNANENDDIVESVLLSNLLVNYEESALPSEYVVNNVKESALIAEHSLLKSETSAIVACESHLFENVVGNVEESAMKTENAVNHVETSALISKYAAYNVEHSALKSEFATVAYELHLFENVLGNAEESAMKTENIGGNTEVSELIKQHTENNHKMADIMVESVTDPVESSLEAENINVNANDEINMVDNLEITLTKDMNMVYHNAANEESSSTGKNVSFFKHGALGGNIFDRLFKIVKNANSKECNPLQEVNKHELINEDMSPSEIYNILLNSADEMLSDSENEDDYLVSQEEAGSATAYLMNNRPHQHTSRLSYVISKLQEKVTENQFDLASPPDFKNAVLWVLKNVTVSEDTAAQIQNDTDAVVIPTLKNSTQPKEKAACEETNHESDCGATDLSESACTVHELLHGGTWRHRVSSLGDDVAVKPAAASANSANAETISCSLDDVEHFKSRESNSDGGYFPVSYVNYKRKACLPAALVEKLKPPNRPKMRILPPPPELQSSTSFMRSSLNIDFQRSRARTKRSFRSENDLNECHSQHYYVRSTSEEDGTDLKLVIRKVPMVRNNSHSGDGSQQSTTTTCTKPSSNSMHHLVSPITAPVSFIDNVKAPSTASVQPASTTVTDSTSSKFFDASLKTNSPSSTATMSSKQCSAGGEPDESEDDTSSQGSSRCKVPRMLRQLENTTGYVAEVQSAAMLQREQRALLRAWQLIAEREQEERLKMYKTADDETSKLVGVVGVAAKRRKLRCKNSMYDSQIENKLNSCQRKSLLNKRQSSKSLAANKIRTKYVATNHTAHQQRLKSLRSQSSTSTPERSASTRRVLLLLKRGASDQYGRTALHLCAEFGDSSLLRECLNKGQSVGAFDANRFTPLHLACLRGNVETARILLQVGADVNAAGGTNGVRPIHKATESGNVDLVKLLLEAGADPTAETYDGCNLQQISRSKHMTAFLEGLFSGLRSSSTACTLTQHKVDWESTAAVSPEESIDFELLERKFPTIYLIDLLSDGEEPQEMLSLQELASNLGCSEENLRKNSAWKKLTVYQINDINRKRLPEALREERDLEMVLYDEAAQSVLGVQRFSLSSADSFVDNELWQNRRSQSLSSPKTNLFLTAVPLTQNNIDSKCSNHQLEEKKVEVKIENTAAIFSSSSSSSGSDTEAAVMTEEDEQKDAKFVETQSILMLDEKQKALSLRRSSVSTTATPSSKNTVEKRSINRKKKVAANADDVVLYESPNSKKKEAECQDGPRIWPGLKSWSWAQPSTTSESQHRKFHLSSVSSNHKAVVERKPSGLLKAFRRKCDPRYLSMPPPQPPKPSTMVAASSSHACHKTPSFSLVKDLSRNRIVFLYDELLQNKNSANATLSYRKCTTADVAKRTPTIAEPLSESSLRINESIKSSKYRFPTICTATSTPISTAAKLPRIIVQEPPSSSNHSITQRPHMVIRNERRRLKTLSKRFQKLQGFNMAVNLLNNNHSKGVAAANCSPKDLPAFVSRIRKDQQLAATAAQRQKLAAAVEVLIGNTASGQFTLQNPTSIVYNVSNLADMNSSLCDHEMLPLPPSLIRAPDLSPINPPNLCKPFSAPPALVCAPNFAPYNELERNQSSLSLLTTPSDLHDKFSKQTLSLQGQTSLDPTQIGASYLMLSSSSDQKQKSPRVLHTNNACQEHVTISIDLTSEDDN